jgi:hypothetical protein
MTGDVSSLLALSAGLITAAEAVAAGLVTVDGPTDAVDRATAVVGSNFADAECGGGFVGAVRARVVPVRRPRAQEVCGFCVDDQTFHVVVDGNDVRSSWVRRRSSQLSSSRPIWSLRCRSA